MKHFGKYYAFLGFPCLRSCNTKDGKPKAKYESPQVAHKVACKMAQKYKTAFRVYKCSVCGAFHIGKIKGE